MADEKLFDDRIAIGVRFNPPVEGDVLSFAGDPTWVPAETLPSAGGNKYPQAPTNLSYESTVAGSLEGGAATADISVAWVAPTLFDDDSEIYELSGYQVMLGTYRLSGLIPYGQNWFKLKNLPLGTEYEVSVVAITIDGLSSPALTGLVTTASPVPVPDVTNVVGVGVAHGVARVTCDALTRSDMMGFLVSVRWQLTETPTWTDWSNSGMVVCGSGQPLNSIVAVSATAAYHEVRVKAVVYGGSESTNWTSCAAFMPVGIASDDFSMTALNDEIARLIGSGAIELVDGSGLVVKNGKMLFYSDDSTATDSFLRVGLQGGVPQVVAANASGQKALIGQSGTFWGLYVEGGALQIKTAGDTVTIDSSGIIGISDGITKFQLDSTGLTLRNANIILTSGGTLENGLRDAYDNAPPFDYYIELSSLTVTALEKQRLHKCVARAAITDKIIQASILYTNTDLHESPEVVDLIAAYESARDAFSGMTAGEYNLLILRESMDSDTTLGSQADLDALNLVVSTYFSAVDTIDTAIQSYFVNPTGTVMIDGTGIHIGTVDSGPNSQLTDSLLQFKFDAEIRVEIGVLATTIRKAALMGGTTIDTAVSLPDAITVGDMLFQKTSSGMNINFI
jgi:hypothetical protein